jgi:hypothetical protein
MASQGNPSKRGELLYQYALRVDPQLQPDQCLRCIWQAAPNVLCEAMSRLAWRFGFSEMHH